MANTTHSMTTYVSDMLAVERHIKTAFETQQRDGDFQEYQDVRDVVTRLAALGERHVTNLSSMLEQLGGHEAAPLKNAVGTIEGVIAGAIDKIRKTKVSKALRDDYAALAFAIVSYEELLATANGTGNAEVATLAERQLEDYASVIMDVGECIPGVVVRELSAMGIDVDTSTTERTRESIRQAWRSRAEVRIADGETPRTTRGDIGLEQDELIGSPEVR